MVVRLYQQQRLKPEVQLTPQMQQFIKLIQMPITELNSYIHQEIEQNPLLEEIPKETDEKEPIEEGPDPEEEFLSYLYSPVKEEYVENTSHLEKKEIPLKANESWQEQLLKEVRYHLNAELYSVLEFIIFNLSSEGFLRISPEEIAKETNTDTDTVKSVIRLIQTIGPPGICARDTRECLLIQIEREEGKNSPTYKIVSEAFIDLIKQRYRKIAKQLKIPIKQVYWAMERLAHYQTRPLLKKEESVQIIPEFEIKIVENQIIIDHVGQRLLPRIGVNQEYVQTLKRQRDPRSKEFLRTYLHRAKMMINAIREREEKLYQLIEFLAHYQREFVESGPAYLKPLTMKKVAKYVNLSESTVSRLANQKYVQLPWGCVQLKEFFLNPLSYTNNLPRQAILEEIKEIIHKSPNLSDEKIREELLKRGIQISRRTVNKYRHMINK